MFLISTAWAIDVPGEMNLTQACNSVEDGGTIVITEDLGDDECNIDRMVHLTTDGGTYSVGRVMLKEGCDGTVLENLVFGGQGGSVLTAIGGEAEARDIVIEAAGDFFGVSISGGTLVIDGLVASDMGRRVIYAEPHTADIDLTVRNAQVTNAQAGFVQLAGHGGAITATLEDCDVGEVADAQASGLAVSAYAGMIELNVIGGRFHGLAASSMKLGSGRGELLVVVDGTEFLDNAADEGAAILTDVDVDLRVTGALFRANEANLGGALAVDGPTLVEHSVFCANSAAARGAHVFGETESLGLQYNVFNQGS